MRIDEAAKYYAISVRTLRYYAQQGLLHPTRDDANIRNFDHEQLRRLELILVLKLLHMPLRRIREVLGSDDSLHAMLHDQLTQLNNTLHDVHYRQQLLQSLLKTYGDQDISRHNIDALIREQVYLRADSERQVPMSHIQGSIIVEIGEHLIPLAYKDNPNGLIAAVKSLRQQIESQYNCTIDLIRIRDNVDTLAPTGYQILRDDQCCVHKDVANLPPDVQVDHIISQLKALLI